jgi:hypothetical protein
MFGITMALAATKFPWLFRHTAQQWAIRFFKKKIVSHSWITSFLSLGRFNELTLRPIIWLFAVASCFRSLWNTLPRPALSSGPTPSHAVHPGPTASCSTAVHVGKKEKVHSDISFNHWESSILSRSKRWILYSFKRLWSLKIRFSNLERHVF